MHKFLQQKKERKLLQKVAVEAILNNWIMEEKEVEAFLIREEEEEEEYKEEEDVKETTLRGVNTHKQHGVVFVFRTKQKCEHLFSDVFTNQQTDKVVCICHEKVQNFCERKWTHFYEKREFYEGIYTFFVVE